MDVKDLSSTYHVRRLTAQDMDAIYELSIGNPLFYEYCPPYVTREGIAEDMRALPPGRHDRDKFYVGYFSGDELIAIMDLIFSYPAKSTAWIGLFMMDQRHQNRGNIYEKQQRSGKRTFRVVCGNGRRLRQKPAF